MAARAMARSNAGNAIIKSVNRMMTIPVHPLAYPATMPKNDPIKRAMPLAAIPIIRRFVHHIQAL